MNQVNNNGIHIHYQITGDGPPLVLHHGFSDDLRSWYEYGYVAALAPHYRLILIDSRGHGGSDKPHAATAYTQKARTYDVLAVLDALQIDQAFYLGYSLGGWIGFGLATYAPERFHAFVLGGRTSPTSWPPFVSPACCTLARPIPFTRRSCAARGNCPAAHSSRCPI